MITHKVRLEKKSQRFITGKVKSQVEKLEMVMNADRSQFGWSMKHEGAKYQEIGGEGYLFNIVLEFSYNSERKRSDKAISKSWNNIVRTLEKLGNRPGMGWKVALIDGAVPKLADEGDMQTVGYCPVKLPDNWPDFFSHLYERDDQIEIVISALQAAMDSDFMNRFHVVLHGPPASGKSDIAHSLGKALGADAVLEFDATCTTQAGAIEKLEQREELPRVMLIEEIEKAEPDSLRWLLGVMDFRAEIRKVTARKDLQMEARMLVIATVNDFGLFNKLQAGALSSRFSQKLYCGPPDREIMKRILVREVSKVSGKMEWVEPTLEYCETMGIHDPRQATAICLCGKDRLVSGDYQRMMLNCMKPPEKENGK